MVLKSKELKKASIKVCLLPFNSCCVLLFDLQVFKFSCALLISPIDAGKSCTFQAGFPNTFVFPSPVDVMYCSLSLSK